MITLKLQLGKEIRRIGKAPENLEKVKEKAKELFDISSPCFRYRDNENDEITIMNQREYEEALSAHSGPIKLEVLESEILLFERSSAIRNSTKSHVKSDSYSEPSLVYLPEPIMKVKEYCSSLIQTEEIILVHQSTSGPELKDQRVEANLTADAGISCKNHISGYQELLRSLKRCFYIQKREKKTFLGVKCCKCHNDIFDVLYKCNQCPWFYMCEDCETNDSHSHILIKSRNLVMSSPVKTIPKIVNNPEISDLKTSTNKHKPETTDAGDSNIQADLNGKIQCLKTMGFENKDECLDALIKNNYNLERSINFLLIKTNS